MRSSATAVLLIAIVACKKQEPPAGSSSSGSGSAGSAIAGSATSLGSGTPALDAPPPTAARVDLLRAVPVAVTVSSQVANPTILPSHLVDHDLATAWNSRTGELEGAWVRVVVPEGAVIEELRLTAGHTGRGPKREDYFTMNPRITKLAIEPRGAARSEITLDVARRELQPIAVPATREVTIRVVAIQRDSKPSWREIAISELEVWGTPPPGWTAPAAPLVPKVTVEPPPAATSKLFDQACANLASQTEDRQRKREADATACRKLPEPERSQCGVDEPGDPTCEVTPVEATLAPPWRAVAAQCEVADQIYGPARCAILIDRGGTLVTGPSVELGHKDLGLSVTDARVEEIVGGGAAELVLHYVVHDTEAETETTYLTVCDAKRGCSTPLPIGTAAWSATVRFVGGVVRLTRDAGAPPASALGPHPLTWKP